MGKSEGALKRIEWILDPGSFMETGEQILARNTDFHVRDERARADGVITGYGTIDGRPVYVYSQDSGTLGGSMAEMHAGKILRVYDMAQRTGTPVIALLDSKGLRIREGADALEAYGRLYRAQAEAKGCIPQIAGVFGQCGGAGSLLAAASDFVFMETGAQIFMNPPSARQDLDTSRGLAANNLANAELYPAGIRLRDGVGAEESMCRAIRRLIGYLPLTAWDDVPQAIAEDDLNRSCAGLAEGVRDPMRIVSEIADRDSAMMLQNEHADGIQRFFARFNGRTVGVVGHAADGRMTVDVCDAMSEFIEFCGAFGIPVLSLTDTVGFSTDEKQEAGLPKAAARLACAFAACDVPKINLITGQALGNSYAVMNNKGQGADFVFAWEQARVQVMQADAAVRILYEEELRNAADKAAFLKERTEQYEKHAGTDAFLARGYIDRVISPVDTRKYIVGALEMLSDKRTI